MNLSLTYLDTYPHTYSPGTHKGRLPEETFSNCHNYSATCIVLYMRRCSGLVIACH